MSEESTDKVASAIKQALDRLQQEEGITARVGVDDEAGIVKVYTEKSDALGKASSGLADVLELAYTTAEHHPYWGMLYHATEISKMLLEKWDSDLLQDNVSEIAWRCDEIRMALDRAGRTTHDGHDGD
jgi:hypothetical protein